VKTPHSFRIRSRRRWTGAVCVTLSALAAAPGHADNLTIRSALEDGKLYFTAPLHWDEREWLEFGGTLALIGAAHHYDESVRNHFTAGSSTALTQTTAHDARDYAPAAAAVLGTFAYAALINDSSGYREVASMLEAGALSGIDVTLLKYAAGRLRPDQTSDPNRWRAHGASFPAGHASTAFAIGTVLAESGGDDYRWIRRTLGYGLATATAYVRVRDNAHWLSDTVAGAALGAVTAQFVMHRRGDPPKDAAWGIEPVEGGIMLTFSFNPH